MGQGDLRDGWETYGHLDTTTLQGKARQAHGPLPDKSGVPMAVSICARNVPKHTYAKKLLASICFLNQHTRSGAAPAP